MKLLRTWPAAADLDAYPANAGQPHVIDGIERVELRQYDYRPVLARAADDEHGAVVLEWDIAVGRDQLARFLGRAYAEPTWCRVAPYQLHAGGRSPWCLFRADPGPDHVELDRGNPRADYFGWGMTYLPAAIAIVALADPELNTGASLSDGVFSRWHYRHFGPVPVDWDCAPVHLHYDATELLRPFG